MKELKVYTDAQRQKAGDLLVGREVHACVSMMVDELLRAHHISSDLGFDLSELENFSFHECPECGGRMEEDEVWTCEDCTHRQTQEPEYGYAEVSEWWIVDSFLACNLSERGEVIYDGYGPSLWGRCTTGQGIALDCVIQSIALGLDWIQREVKEAGA